MNINRRMLLERIVQLLSAVIFGILALPPFRFVAASLAESESASWYPIARVDLFVPGEVTKRTFTRLIRDGWSTRFTEEHVWVRKNSDGSFTIFEPHCTHLGCAYEWNPESMQFLCPCHGGKFNQNGERIAGPPPRPLDRYQVKLEGGLLKIGKVMRKA